VLVMVYTGEIIGSVQGMRRDYDHAMFGYALDTGQYLSRAMAPAGVELDFSTLR
jgi:hypothetical protein